MEDDVTDGGKRVQSQTVSRRFYLHEGILFFICGDGANINYWHIGVLHVSCFKNWDSLSFLKEKKAKCIWTEECNAVFFSQNFVHSRSPAHPIVWRNKFFDFKTSPFQNSRNFTGGPFYAQQRIVVGFFILEI